MSRQQTARRREENEVEFGRIVAFSDGVFAIAITLLVLNLSVPEHIHGDDLNQVLWEQRQDLLAYAISFAVIGRFWIVHHRFFGSVIGFDGRLLGLNLFYLGWIALFPFSAQVFGDHAGDTAAIALYAVNLSAISLVGMLMATDARRAGLATMSPEEARDGQWRALTVAIVFLASIPVALIDPQVAPLLWLALFVDPVGRRVRRRRNAQRPRSNHRLAISVRRYLRPAFVSPSPRGIEVGRCPQTGQSGSGTTDSRSISIVRRS